MITACQASPAHDYSITEKRQPALWRVTDEVGGNAGYLFGTIHMLPPGIDWQTAELIRALAASDRLVKEIAADDTPPSLDGDAMVADEPVKPLSARLGKDDYEKYRVLSGALPLDDDAMQLTESWAIALRISSAQFAVSGLEKRHGVDSILEQAFEKSGRPIIALDTARTQFQRFDDLSPITQDRLLSLAIRDAINADNAAEAFETIVNDWLSGDVDGSIRRGDGPFADASIRGALLEEPNREWAMQIGRMLRSGHRPFVAVGASHMAGGNGLPSLLKKQGLIVERIQ